MAHRAVLLQVQVLHRCLNKHGRGLGQSSFERRRGQNSQKLGLFADSVAQVGRNRARGHRSRDGRVAFTSTPFPEVGRQLARTHISITSRSVSAVCEIGVDAGSGRELAAAGAVGSGPLVAQASTACLSKLRGTLRSVSVCMSEFSGAIAAGSRKSISASTDARRTSGEESSSAAIRCGVASRS